MRPLLAVLLIAAAALPASAQVAPETAPRTKFVTIFGTEQCPKSTDPDEIIVCRPGNEEQQFRIPEAVRDSATATAREDDVPGSRAALVDSRVGGGPCSPAGTQGQFGCNTGVDLIGPARKAIDAATGNTPIPEAVPPQ